MDMLPKSILAKILSKVWEKLNRNIITNGFQKLGIYAFKDIIPKEKYEPEADRRWYLLQQNRSLPESPSLSEPCPSTSLTESRNMRHVQKDNQILILDKNSANACPPFTESNRSFETLLLQQLKQTPRTTIGRKRICGGAEVITSSEALEKLRH